MELWSEKISSLSRRSYCTPLHLTNVVVYGVLNATSHLFGQGYLYLTDAQIIKEGASGASTKGIYLVKCAMFF